MSQGEPPVRRNQPLHWLLLSPRFSYFDLGVGAFAAVAMSKAGAAAALAVFAAGALITVLLVGLGRRDSGRRG